MDVQAAADPAAAECIHAAAPVPVPAESSQSETEQRLSEQQQTFEHHAAQAQRALAEARAHHVRIAAAHAARIGADLHA